MRWSLDKKITAGFVVALLIVCVTEYLSYRTTSGLIRASRQVVHTQRVLDALDNILITLDDAETGQRGYLLTGKEFYLEPYEAAKNRLSRVLATLDKLTPYESDRQRNLEDLSRLVREEQQELAATIAMKRANKTEDLIKTGVLTGNDVTALKDPRAKKEKE